MFCWFLAFSNVPGICRTFGHIDSSKWNTICKDMICSHCQHLNFRIPYWFAFSNVNFIWKITTFLVDRFVSNRMSRMDDKKIYTPKQTKKKHRFAFNNDRFRSEKYKKTKYANNISLELFLKWKLLFSLVQRVLGHSNGLVIAMSLLCLQTTAKKNVKIFSLRWCKQRKC